MAANDRLQRWRQELHDLQLLRARLADAWDAGLLELRTSGRPPALELADEQVVYARRLASLTADAALDHPQIARSPRTSLYALSNLCDELSIVQDARSVLQQLLDWEHATEPEFEPLRLVQAHAHRHLNELARTPLPPDMLATFRELAVGQHALCDLVKLQRSGDEMHDQEWTRLHDRVIEVFGRALATAIGRGRILSKTILAPVVVPEPPLPPVAASFIDDLVLKPVEDPVLLEPEPPSPQADSVIDIVPPTSGITPPAAPVELLVKEPPPGEPDFVYDFASTGSRMTGVLDVVVETALEKPPAVPVAPPEISNGVDAVFSNDAPVEDVKPDSGLLEAWSQLRETRAHYREDRAPHEAPASALADAALQATGEERVRCLFRLIDQLLIDDEPALAYHLMNTVEGLSPERLAPLPASLMRAYLVSREVCFPQGELNRSIEDDLRKQQPRRHQESAPEERLAHGLMCRAAALLPAILCSSSSAVRLLQAFPIEPGLSQLYNYCSRIASYTERLQGMTAEMLLAGRTGAPTSQELESLRNSARTWLTQTIKQTLPYARSSPLFSHAHWTVTAGTVQQFPEVVQIWTQWQETWLTVHRLLRPVEQGTAGDRNWVKHEIDRLLVLLYKEPSRNGHPLSHEAEAAAAAMRDVLTQAVEYANGWLRLQAASPAPSTNLPIRELDELRAEIRERSAGVLAELRPFASIQKSPTLRAATFCLQRVVQQIEAFFTDKAALSWREPELKRLLHAELLKIPCLPLNDEWEPQVDAGELETELLQHISRGARTWKEAFQQQSQLRDHTTTGRLLELPVWNAAGELAELTRQRHERIADCRRELQAELNILETDAQLLRDGGHLSDSDCATVERRLERLRAAVPRTLDFPIADIQLQQVRLMLQRRSASPPQAAGYVPPKINGNGFHPSPEHDAIKRPADQPPDIVSESEAEPANPWVMDILFEDR